VAEIPLGMTVVEAVGNLADGVGLGHLFDAAKFSGPGDYFIRIDMKQDADGRSFLTMFEAGRKLPMDGE
jgi:hypothetical protein